VTHHRRPAAPAFVPIVTDAMPAEAAAPAMLATPVIEVRLAGAVVRVVSGLDDTQLTAVLRAVRASALRA
jgi:transposase